MKKRTLRHEDYTVGWVCALPIELSAAQVMLDEVHGQLPTDLHDNVLYTVGSIGKHNVVIACLPSGRMGTISAAVVSTEMRRKFTSIRFGLMVGIGGGVPNLKKNIDIRLGDVVISHPDKDHGGVVQYDFGKTTPDGFSRTGSLNTPPNILLNAISNMRSRYANKMNEEDNLSTYLAKFDKLSHFNRDKAGRDILFQADYNHEGGYTCAECDQTQVEPRDPLNRPEVMIHYGTIASGDQVMKHGRARDDLSKQLGDILCFEMEAAGLMNDFPCLVVRGICDYADSHKNKTWQPYAAATAAACAKEILTVIPAAQVVQAPPIPEAAPDPVSRQLLRFAFGPLSKPPFEKNPKFVAHGDILKRIEQKFKKNPRVALYGSSGYGKTCIAIQYAHLYSENNPDAKVLWVNARNVEQFEHSFKTIGHNLHIQNIHEPKTNVLNTVKRYLSQDAHGPWLMILDGADDADTFLKSRAKPAKQEKPDKKKPNTLLDYVPKCLSGLVLITSQSHSLASKMIDDPNMQHAIEISLLNREESISLLREILSEDFCDDQETTELVEALHRSPIAIILAATYIKSRNKEVSIAEYLTNLKSQTLRLNTRNAEDTAKATAVSDAENVAVAAWQILYEFIHQKHPEAARILLVMGVLDLQSIPVTLLNKWSNDPNEVKNAISTLDQFNMITSLDNQRYVTVTRLLQLSIQSWLTQKEQKTWADDRALRLVTDAFPEAEDEEYETCEILYPYANLVLNFKRSLIENKLQRATLLSNMAGYNQHLGKYDLARRRLEEALKLREEEPSQAGDLIQETKKALEAVRESQRQAGSGAQSIMSSIEKQGSPWPSQLLRTSRWPKAVSKVQGFLQLAQQSLDQERHQEAEARSKEGLEECEKMLGKDHEDTLRMTDCLAMAYQSQGRQDEALITRTRVLDWCKAKYGPNHLDTMRQTYNLALTYDLQGQYDQATTLYLEALEGTKKLLGPDNPEALRIICSLATVYDLQGRTTEAEATFHEALDGQRARLGDNHPETLLTLHNLALCAQARHDFATAESYLLHVLAAQEQLFGPQHSATLRTAANLALNFRLRHELAQAAALYQIALDGQRARLGEDHPDTLTTRHMLAELYEEQGQVDNAREQYQLAFEGRNKVLGEGHRDTVLTKKRLEGLPTIEKAA